MAENMKDLPIGYEFPAASYVMTQERMTIYTDMVQSCTEGPAGVLRIAPSNIHNDLEFAKGQGLPAPIGDGVIMTAWAETELRKRFGVGYMKGGRLMNKFIKPVFAGDTVAIKFTIKDKVPQGEATKLVMDVNMYNQKGDLVVVGEAAALVK